jgi:hypothetical protein
VYFFNESAQPFSHTVTLKSSGKAVEDWDAQTGKISAALGHHQQAR